MMPPDPSNDDGNDRKNPWGRSRGQGGGNPPSWNNGPGGEPPPEVVELLSRAKGNFGQVMGGNEAPDGRILGILLLLAVGVWLLSGFYIIEPGEHGVVQRFGAWNRTQATEGLGYHIPWPVEALTKVNVTAVRQMRVGFIQTRRGQKQDLPEESLMLTADRNIVDLDLVVQWNIKSAEDFVFKIRDQENTIKKVAESAIREVVGQTPMFSVITEQRADVANRAQEIMIRNLDEYESGVNISQVLIEEAEVHPDVQNAFQDVQSAKQDGEDVQNRAQAYREDILPKARGRAIEMKQQAEAYKKSVIARATGDAERFKAVYQAYLSGQDVTKQRIYIETMEEVLKNAEKIIMDGEGGVVPYLPLNELKPAAGNQSLPQPSKGR